MRRTWMARRIVRYWLGCLLSPMDAILIDSASEQFQLGIFVCSIVAQRNICIISLIECISHLFDSRFIYISRLIIRFIHSFLTELLGFLAMKIIRERLRLLNGLNSGSRPGPSTVSTLLLQRKKGKKKRPNVIFALQASIIIESRYSR